MQGRVQSIDQLPATCVDALLLLSDFNNESEIINKIVLEVYNGWPGKTGESRVLDCLKFIEKRIPQYAKLMNMSNSLTLEVIANRRRVNYTNWFQNGYIPDLSDVMVFETVQDFKNRFPSGQSICPACESISTDFSVCNSGKKIKGKVCDWKVYGLFGDMGKGIRVIIKDKFMEFPKPTVMFRPIELSRQVIAN